MKYAEYIYCIAIADYACLQYILGEIHNTYTIVFPNIVCIPPL